MKTKTVYLVHDCGDWGSLAGIYTDKEIAIDDIIKYYRNNYDFTESELQEVRQQLQDFYYTQGITKADNFEIEVKSLNEWDW